MGSQLNILTNNDIDEFNSILNLYGFSKANFGLIQLTEIKDDEDTKNTKCEIKVVRKSTNAERVYEVNPDSMWLMQFKDDLKHGGFGQSDV